ncbi:peptide-methionine (S)-S-oxide reductase [Onishia taeanensis]|uniref:Peptide methionine sulfoxide reductase MsrA n=1 Tax=Onishia taeanensis TaxID=284577 RepID=A0A328XTZ9_9GAMM|nr:peptide-methionine (S)-S-oxide reductase MsrA [Halomonas taeanensis]RAR59711.1 peptide-methionine (S)-S-oxide reductase [Halomonas taeanensis]
MAHNPHAATRFAFLATHRWFRALPLALAIGASADALAADPKDAVFAGGCFWCMEEAFDKVPGVLETTSGYSGGTADTATYSQVSAGRTEHAEVVQVEYDPDEVSYEQLLNVFWRNIDPFAVDRQFCDVGTSYRSAIFPMNEEERVLAKDSLDEMQARFERDIATQIEAFKAFYPAEDYHQNYYKTNSLRYHFYKSACGRVDRLEQVWGDEAGTQGALSASAQ